MLVRLYPRRFHLLNKIFHFFGLLSLLAGQRKGLGNARRGSGGFWFRHRRRRRNRRL
jgi:hypothetical protein